MPLKASILKKGSLICVASGGSWVPWGKVVKGQVCVQCSKAFSCSASHGWKGLISLICYVGYCNRFYRREKLIVVVKDVFDTGRNRFFIEGLGARCVSDPLDCDGLWNSLITGALDWLVSLRTHSGMCWSDRRIGACHLLQSTGRAAGPSVACTEAVSPGALS